MDGTGRVRRRRMLVAIIAVLAILAVGSLTVSGSGIAGDVSAGPADPYGTAAQEEIDADSVHLTLTIDEDGTAAWTVEYRQRLDTDDRETAFESLRTDVEENPEEYVDDFADSMDRTVESAANETEREMSASDYTVSAETRSLPQEYGVLTYTFEWHGFAAVDGDRLVIGDAIAGFYLDDDTQLVIEWPDGYEAVEVEPEPDETRSDSVLWQGSTTTFVGDEPRVVVEPAGANGAESDDGSEDEGTGGMIERDAEGVPLLPGGMAITMFAVLAALWWLYSKGLSDEGDSESAVSESDPESGTGTAADSEPAAGGERADGDDSAASDEAVPSELLSNEERVVQLLERNDGRMKQQQIVQQLDWTDAKTSQVISDLREAETVETFRIGRENVVRLPEADDQTNI